MLLADRQVEHRACLAPGQSVFAAQPGSFCAGGAQRRKALERGGL
jgi:hypothetical protein